MNSADKIKYLKDQIANAIAEVDKQKEQIIIQMKEIAPVIIKDSAREFVKRYVHKAQTFSDAELTEQKRAVEKAASEFKDKLEGILTSGDFWTVQKDSSLYDNSLYPTLSAGPTSTSISHLLRRLHGIAAEKLKPFGYVIGDEYSDGKYGYSYTYAVSVPNQIQNMFSLLNEHMEKANAFHRELLAAEKEALKDEIGKKWDSL